MDRLNELKEKALKLTTSPGVYLMKNSKMEIIYIGKAKNLKNRVVSYFRNISAHNEKVSKMVENVYDFDFFVTDSEFEALVLECSLIKQNKPKYNILLKDSKGYKYVKITNEYFPKITVCGKKSDDGAQYIGPYVSSFSVKQAVEEVNRVFLLPICKNDFSKNIRNKRPCLNFYIKRCMGLCRNKISRQEYLKIIEEAKSYIKKGDVLYIEKIKKQMEKAAREQDFEHAIKLRDKIKAIEKINQTQKVFLNDRLDADVISFSSLGERICFVVLKFRNGKISDKEDFVFKDTMGIERIKEEFLAGYYYKKKLIPKKIILGFELENFSLYEQYLNEQSKKKVVVKIPKKGTLKDLTSMAYENSKEILSFNERTKFKENKTLKELQNLLGLKSLPNYIEAYDISNLGDSGIVGGMVVFENGVCSKKKYRKFKIKTVFKRDDYACMKEVLKRRIERFKEKKDDSFKNKPDVIFLDGGKTHVLAAKEVLDLYDFKVPYFGLVKDSKHKTRAISSKDGEIEINSKKNIFLFLKRVQDEVHRFTISYQKNVRKQYNLKISLTNLKGVGEKTAIKILKNFSSIEDLKKASSTEISKKIDVSLKKAEEIVDFLKYY